MLSRMVRTSGLGRRGATLIELMVVVAIVGILAAVAIPVFSRYVKESRLSEAVTNIQGILEAEQAFYVRFQRYTPILGWCPQLLPGRGETQLWPRNVAIDCDAPAGSGASWATLGFRPDGPVYFRYRVFSHNDPAAASLHQQPAALLPSPGWAIDWAAEGFNVADAPPWCAVEAEADVDGDGSSVFIRSNSYNHRTYRSPNPDVDKLETW